jgi:DNA-binding protein H-NS
MLTRWLDALRRLFDYTGRQREIQQANEERLAGVYRDSALAQAAAHEHTLEMVEVIMTRMEGIHKANAEASAEQARAFSKNAEALQTWFKMFEQNQGDGSVSIVRAEDEADAEDARELARLRAAGYPVDAQTPTEVASFLSTLFTPPPN